MSYPRSAEPPKEEIPDLEEKLTEAEYFPMTPKLQTLLPYLLPVHSCQSQGALSYGDILPLPAPSVPFLMLLPLQPQWEHLGLL